MLGFCGLWRVASEMSKSWNDGMKLAGLFL